MKKKLIKILALSFDQMARQRKQRPAESEEIGLDEVDEFAQGKEQVLLKEAGWDKPEQESSDEDEEEQVMDIDEDDKATKADIDEYRRKLRGPIDEDEEEYFVNEDESEAEEDEGWGISKNDYYGAEDLEEENDEDAKEMEIEALRLQKKHMEELNMDDYMLDETVDEWKKEAKDEEPEEEAPKTVKVSAMDKAEQRQSLEKQYPEFIPLTKDFESLRPTLEDLAARRDQLGEVDRVRYTALASYLGTVATYFALFLDQMSTGEQFSMKNEPIMESILSTREGWRIANKLKPVISQSDDEVVIEQEEEESEIGQSQHNSDIDESGSNSDSDSFHSFSEESEVEETPKLRRSIKHLKKKKLEDIDEIDLEEKKGRRKTLGFYTSKIDQTDKKKKTKFQGDEDIPYKERLFERQQRLLEEARKRGDISNKSAPGVDLGDDLDDEEPEEVLDIDDDAYYESMKSKKDAKKHAKENAVKLAKKAIREGNYNELMESVDDDGKRAINFQILKNKGLTKKRKKENRNSRVKKRLRYAKAQKKLSSVRAVYKAPEGPYQGEKTGIKKNLSRSVKLA